MPLGFWTSDIAETSLSSGIILRSRTLSAITIDGPQAGRIHAWQNISMNGVKGSNSELKNPSKNTHDRSKGVAG
jgi:hypothetical protein